MRMDEYVQILVDGWRMTSGSSHREMAVEAVRALVAAKVLEEPDPAESIAPAEDLLETLEMAREALERVERAYHESTSKRITAPMYRPVRDARARCEQSVTALAEAIRVVGARA
jgi:hypothetical protein